MFESITQVQPEMSEFSREWVRIYIFIFKQNKYSCYLAAISYVQLTVDYNIKWSPSY